MMSWSIVSTRLVEHGKDEGNEVTEMSQTDGQFFPTQKGYNHCRQVGIHQTPGLVCEICEPTYPTEAMIN